MNGARQQPCSTRQISRGPANEPEMDPKCFDQVDKIFQTARELDRENRSTFLDRACAGDSELRSEVERLLLNDEKAQEFIGSAMSTVPSPHASGEQSRKLVEGSIGPFNILSLLGSGGMGDVYLAEDSRLGRRIALKLLNPSLSGDSHARQRFLREARLASALDHPNVCTIHEVGEVDGRLFIAMQHLEGKTLLELIAGRPLELSSLISIGRQVGEALAAAHARGIIHRDIKSNNIIVTPQGQVKVLDFGLAKALAKDAHNESSLTYAGFALGTPSFMSPEQARGETADERSDLFSFGVVLYEMAAGRTPFVKRSSAETMNAVITEPHTPVKELNKNVPSALSAVIDRALAKVPGDRYQSIEEMLVDLRNVGGQSANLRSDAADSVTERTQSYATLVQTDINRSRNWLRSPRWKAILTLGAAVILVGLALMAYIQWPKQGTVPAAEIKSIAVLPFKPLLEHSRDEALEMGMADTLIAKLSNLREVNVRPISAVRKYAGLEQDAVKAGLEQRVDAVVDGQIQKADGKIRLTVRMVRVGDGTPLWTDQFDEKITDIFAVQDSISKRVAEVLAVKLTGAERELLTKRFTENAEAYQLYMMGRYHLNRLNDEGTLKSLEYFQQAVVKDRNFALAHAGIAESYNALGGFNVLRPGEVYPKAQSAAGLALGLDDHLAQAHTALGVVKLAYHWDWPGAEIEYKRALEINPGGSDAHSQYGYYLAFVGRFDEAVAEMRRAQELDPVSLVRITGMGQVLFLARRYDEAIERCRKALEMDPNLGFAHWIMGMAYLWKGMHEQAIVALQKSIPLSGQSLDEPASLGVAYALSGKSSEARKIMEDLKQQSKSKYLSPCAIAFLHAALGEKDQAFALLEKGFHERDSVLVLIKVEPEFDLLRSDPRFADLLRRVGLPH